jgi:hypothetical protein
MYFPIPLLVSVPEKVVSLFVAAALVFWHWNSTVPEVFGLKRLTYWQAFRLLAMIAITLFWLRGAIH